MKKFLSLTLAILFVILSVPAVMADTICGEVVYTDIRAYINGLPIRSYNIDGWTGIVAEDLRAYGMNVEWYGDRRELYVYKSEYFPEEVTADYTFEEITKPKGTHAAYVYETDIKTYVAGQEVKAFNIGGYTIIYIDDLQRLGDVIWSEGKREISFTYRKPWYIVLKRDVATGTGNNLRHEGYAPDGAETYSGGISHIKLRSEKNENDEFITSGENLEHLSWITLGFDKADGGLSFAFSMIAEHLLSDYEFSSLCSDMLMKRYDGEIISNNVDFVNEHAKFTINGQETRVKYVFEGKGNNHRDFYFLLDADLNQEDIKEITVEIK